MMPTALAGGAAHGSAGGRRTGGHGQVRVLKGYSNSGTEKKELKKGVLRLNSTTVLKQGTQNGYSRRGYSKSGDKNDCSKRVAEIGVRKKGYSKGGSSKRVHKGWTERLYPKRVAQKGVLEKGYSKMRTRDRRSQ